MTLKISDALITAMADRDARAAKRRSEGMEQVRQAALDAGWGRLALAAGFEPLDTESAARQAFQWAYDNMVDKAWKDNAQSALAALNFVEEAVTQLLPVTIKAQEHLPNPEPMTQAINIVAGLHKIRAKLEKPE